MRYRKGLAIKDVFPTKEVGKCAYCGKQLKGKQRRWCSKKCEKTAVKEFRIAKGDIKTIRKELTKRDKGKCAHCGTNDKAWDADHIIAVVNGGWGCDLSGYQTLCKPCHKKKTQKDLKVARKKSNVNTTKNRRCNT